MKTIICYRCDFSRKGSITLDGDRLVNNVTNAVYCNGELLDIGRKYYMIINRRLYRVTNIEVLKTSLGMRSDVTDYQAFIDWLMV